MQKPIKLMAGHNVRRQVALVGFAWRNGLAYNSLLATILVLPSSLSGQTIAKVPSTEWNKLDTVPYQGKQDDIYMLPNGVGWYGNGQGKLYKTIDGGSHWDEQWNEPGTFIRALGFVDDRVGILGNVGVGNFPGVTDETALYRTEDGGDTWNAVTIEGPQPKGICAIDVYRLPFINHGVLGYHTTIRAGGRVNGPAYLLTSHDDGLNWTSRNMSDVTSMILDIKFVSSSVGFIAGATSSDVEHSHALVLRTLDGGATWHKVYESARSWEITWKLAFPSPQVGYVTVQNYDPAKANQRRVVAKTVDGGRHWTEVTVLEDHNFTEFGIGFITPLHGWLGGSSRDFETFDGGKSWMPSDFGKAVNKIRIVPSDSTTRVYAIGSSLYMRAK